MLPVAVCYSEPNAVVFSCSDVIQNTSSFCWDYIFLSSARAGVETQPMNICLEIQALRVFPMLCFTTAGETLSFKANSYITSFTFSQEDGISSSISCYVV